MYQQRRRALPSPDVPGVSDAKGPFGIPLRRARYAAHMSQDRLSAISGIEQSKISSLERGLGFPTLDQVAALERGLGLMKGTLIFASGFAAPTTGVQDAIRQDPELPASGKTHLLQVYEFVKATMVDTSDVEEDDESSDASEGDS